jgi:glycerophosphoryl diester phosphodiesterase
MRHRAFRGVVLAFVVGLALQPELAAGQGACLCEAEGVTVIGHRGTGPSSSSSDFGENTLEAFVAAGEQGATMVELDVQLDADGALVVMHDDTVDRTTDGTGCIADLTTTELAALDAAVGTAAEGMGHGVPTVAQVTETVDLALNLELKIADDPDCPATDRDALAAAVVERVAAHDALVVVSSFDPEVLARVEELSPDIETALVSLGDAVDAATDGGFDGVHPAAFAVDDDLVTRAHARGLAVRAWTENSPEGMRRLLEAGVDGIFTDEVEQLVQTVAEVCAEATCPPSTDPSSEPDSGCGVAPSRRGGPTLPWLAWVGLIGLAWRRRV